MPSPPARLPVRVSIISSYSDLLVSAGNPRGLATDYNRRESSFESGVRSQSLAVRSGDMTTSYALGIGVSDSNGHPRLSHGGAVLGFTSQNTILPVLKLAVVVLPNF